MTMELQQAVPIGTSMLHFFGESTSSSEAPAQSSLASRIDASSIPSIPCLLLPIKNRGNQSLPSRILLHGPPKSGKSSLAMNVAYSYASASSALCHSCAAEVCRCVAVTIFRHASQEEADFPLFCHRIISSEEEEEDEPTDFSSRYRKLDDRHRPNGCEDWDTRVLKRIQVQYVSSVREILKELLSLLGKPLPQQPCRAIIVDDLDIIASNTNDANSTMLMMQTLAIAVDTSHALQRLHGTRTAPIVLATTTESKQMVAPWMETVVSLHTCSSSQEQSSWRNRQKEDNTILVSNWKAEVRETETMGNQPSIVEYSVSKSPENGFQIHWMSPSSGHDRTKRKGA